MQRKEACFKNIVSHWALVGWLTAGLSVLVLYATSLILPPSVAILYAMITRLLITGCLHEDGLADFFDSLTMDRCYRKAVSDDQALAMIAERRGEQFDPRIVDAFLCIADQVILARDSINEIEAICDLPDIHGDWWMAF